MNDERQKISFKTKCSRAEIHRMVIQIIVDTIIWAVVGCPLIALYKAGTPYIHGFFCDDQSLTYPYKEDTIPDPILLAGGFSIPFTIIILVELPKCLISKERRIYNKDFVILWKVLWVYSFGFTITEIFIQGPKFAVGGLRPHFMDVCKPDVCQNSSIKSYVTEYTCTETKYGDKVIWQSRQSFPSGHAAFSMYGAIFTGFYLQRRLNVSFSRAFRPVLQTALVVLSLLVTLTRYHDFKHHVSDIIVGHLIGIIAGTFVFKTLGEKAVKSRRVTLRLFCSSDPEATEPTTPTPLIQRQDSSFTSVGNSSMDSKHCLFNGNSQHNNVA